MFLLGAHAEPSIQAGEGSEVQNTKELFSSLLNRNLTEQIQELDEHTENAESDYTDTTENKKNFLDTMEGIAEQLPVYKGYINENFLTEFNNEMAEALNAMPHLLRETLTELLQQSATVDEILLHSGELETEEELAAVLLVFLFLAKEDPNPSILNNAAKGLEILYPHEWKVKQYSIKESNDNRSEISLNEKPQPQKSYSEIISELLKKLEGEPAENAKSKSDFGYAIIKDPSVVQKLRSVDNLRQSHIEMNISSLVPAAEKAEQTALIKLDRAPESRQEFANQIYEALKKTRNSFAHTGTLTIKLNPVHLGHLTIKVSQSHGETIIKIISSTSKAQELLEKSLHHLKALLPQSQLQIDRFEQIGTESNEYQLQKEEQEEDKRERNASNLMESQEEDDPADFSTMLTEFLDKST